MRNKNLQFKINLKLSLILILLIFSKTHSLAQNARIDQQDTIRLSGSIQKGNLILETLTKSLKQQKIYTFRVEIKNSLKVSNVSIKTAFTTKKSDLPDILKTYLTPGNAIISTTVQTDQRNKDHQIPSQFFELNDVDIIGDYTSIEVSGTMEKDKTPFKKTIDFGNMNYFKCFNFTTGIFVNTLVNTDFNLSSDGTKIIKENAMKTDISIGAMANFNYVVSPVFKAGFGLGAAMSPGDAKLRFLFGPSITFGGKNEFAISFGIAYAKLTALSGSISTNGVDYDKPLSNISTTTTTNVQSTSATGVVTNTQTVTNVSITNTFKAIPTYNKWKQGFFIGITYSLIR
jgi:hypothetical protein